MSRSIGEEGGGSARPMTFLAATAFQWVTPKAWVMAVTAMAIYTSPDVPFLTVLLVAAAFGLVNLPCVSNWAAFGVALRGGAAQMVQHRHGRGACVDALAYAEVTERRARASAGEGGRVSKMQGLSRHLSLPRLIAASVGVLAVLFAVGWLTRQDPGEAPYLKILGGGFMFNYRQAEVHYGFTAAVMRPLPTGSIIEASFEDPAGGPAHVVRERVGTGTDRYALRSPPVHGVTADRPYRVDIRVMDREETEVLWRHDLTFRSQLDAAVLPDAPLTVGPGYHRGPGS